MAKKTFLLVVFGTPAVVASVPAFAIAGTCMCYLAALRLLHFVFSR